VLPELVRQKTGVLGMKSMANGILLKSKTVTPIECLHYALNLPTSVVITPAATDAEVSRWKNKRVSIMDHKKTNGQRNITSFWDSLSVPSFLNSNSIYKKTSIRLNFCYLLMIYVR